eukprot:TRINITY_DN12040_c0_g1_i1.p2 TRINITY_DN12040_c0_g1~~TRINITY_DN12040_c0_g1_i1.p2  ORF type:complete len:802 (-),score=182.07 TRINITY_DN12040_c0_g1_i1:2979-5384(-)
MNRYSSLDPQAAANSISSTASTEKSKSYGGGSSLVNPMQKRREAEAAKKKQDEEATAAIYAQFAEDFGSGPSKAAATAFVRGGTVNAGHTSQTPSQQPRVYSLPQPHSTPSIQQEQQLQQQQQAQRTAPVARPSTMSRSVLHVSDDEDEEARQAAAAKNKKHRLMADLMEELKHEQEMREITAVRRGGPQKVGGLPTRGMRSDDMASDEQHSNNLYISNIPAQAEEEDLHDTFSPFGQIFSIKLMQPRSDSDMRRTRTTGFVSFVSHDQAEIAKDCLQGTDMLGERLRIEWSRPVRVPSSFPVRPPTLPLPHQVTPTNWAFAPSRLIGDRVNVQLPRENTIRNIIDRLAPIVLREGAQYEQHIMTKERENYRYRFLFEHGSPENIYYVWKQCAVRAGDTSSDTWRTAAFQMFQGGPFWVPPPLPGSNTSHSSAKRSHDESRRGERGDSYSDSSSDSRRSRSRSPVRHQRPRLELAQSDYDKLWDLLQDLSVSRQLISEAMVFALLHAEAAEDVARIISKSLTNNETPMGTKIARLYLVSDILHNTQAGVKNAAAYRTQFENYLPMILESFNHVYRNITSRITAANVKEYVMKVLRTWESWSLYPLPFLNGLKATLSMTGSTKQQSRAPSGQEAQQPSAAASAAASAVGDVRVLSEPVVQHVASVPAAAVDGEPVNGDNIDGEALDEDIDGVPLDDIDGEPLSEDVLRALANEEEEDIDGVPLEATEDDLGQFDEEMPLEQLQRLCRTHGVNATGSAADLVARLRMVQSYVRHEYDDAVLSSEARAQSDDDDDGAKRRKRRK